MHVSNECTCIAHAAKQPSAAVARFSLPTCANMIGKTQNRVDGSALPGVSCVTSGEGLGLGGGSMPLSFGRSGCMGTGDTSTA